MAAHDEPPAPQSARAVVRVAAAIGLLLLMAAIVSWLFESEMPTEPTASSASAASVAASAPVILAAAVDALPPPVDTTVPSRGDEVELCGDLWIAVEADGKPSEGARRRVELEGDRLAEIATRQLLASPSPRSRAAADHFLANAEREARCETSDCADAARQRLAERQLRRESLARLAASTDDPQVYAWAYQTCMHSKETPGACQQISSAQWARLDPTNAVPWLAVAAEAEKRGDAAGLDDAMFHVAAAERHDADWGRLAGHLLEAVPMDEKSLIGATLVLQAAIGIDAANPLPVAAVGYCKPKDLVDANRRELCDRVASLLVERSNTVLAQGIGVGIGRRAGWSTERLAALETTRQAQSEMFRRRSTSDSTVPLARCEPLRADIDLFRETARLGEIEATRRKMVASGESVADLAASHRRSMAEMAKKVQDAASAAPGGASQPQPAAR